jgi:hypothetical protein
MSRPFELEQSFPEAGKWLYRHVAVESVWLLLFEPGESGFR